MSFFEFAALQQGRCAFSCIHPNASTHGPPTSSAVLVNLGNDLLITKRSLLTESEARLHPALWPECPEQIACQSVLQFLTLGFHFGSFSCIDTRPRNAHNPLENIEFSTVLADLVVPAGMSSNLTAPTI